MLAAMENEPEILKLFELQYDDLLLLSSDSFPESSLNNSSSDRQRLNSISNTILQTLGPTGPGLLSITGVPNSSLYRRKLLPLARKLALLKHEDRKCILKEHGLGSDVSLKNVDRDVSSFAMKLEYAEGKGDLNGRVEKGFGGEFEGLGDVFNMLGNVMVDVGIRLARVCDREIGGRELEQCLLESSAAKGRLIHYHSDLDNLIIREKEEQKKKLRRENKIEKGLSMNTGVPAVKACRFNSCQSEADLTTGQPKLWQQWHYDYGVFTVLTDPLFLYASDECEIEHPTDHTCLQVLDTYNGKLVSINTHPDSFIIQVGESADILSNGRLRATLHAVSKPKKLENVSRETFVVFLQPAWSKTFSLQNYSAQQLTAGNHSHVVLADDSACRTQRLTNLVDDIQSTIPPLSSRLKDGMTFAEFSKETTKQYYGGSGLQSNG